MKPLRDEDQELMLQLKEGEDLALNHLMKRWQRPLVAFIFRYVGSEQDALDLAQETFVRIFEKKASYKPQAKFSTWMFAIAGNLCRNHVRWRQRHPSVELPDTVDVAPSDRLKSNEPSPLEQAGRSDQAKVVAAAVASLPHDLKTTVLLFEYQDLSYQEIGVALGCSRKAVETRLYRARKILKEKLAGGKNAL